MKTVGLAAVAALLMLGTATVATPAQAQSVNLNGATGRNVTWVTFAEGRFQRQADGSWVEIDAGGNIAFRFREIGRDDWSVYLQKDGAPHEVQLDLFRKMITIADSGGPRQDLYPITGARHPGSYQLPPGTRPIAVPAPAPTQYGDYRDTVTSGLTLRRATFADGYFQQTGAGQWTEYNAGNQPVYYFREQSRTVDSVVIFDASRGTGVQFNLPGRMVRISFNGAPYEDLYPITATQHQADGGPASGTRPQGPITTPPVRIAPSAIPSAAANYGDQAGFNVEAGPITSQAEAELKCPALAYRVGGQWNGGWQRRDGRLSVCEIRFNR